MTDEIHSSPVPAGRAWVLNRMVYRLFTTRWFWLVVGLFVGGCGAYIALTAHLYHFEPISGRLARYSYGESDMSLVGHATRYGFTAADFHPALPAHIPSGTLVTIWVLPGFTGIDALQITDSQGVALARYTDDYFDRPAHHLWEDRFFGSLFAIAGGLAVVASLVGPPLIRLKQSLAARAC